MRVAKWNQIMQKFQEKFGWDRGLDLMLKNTRNFMFVKFVPDLNEREEKQLRKILLKVYRDND